MWSLVLDGLLGELNEGGYYAVGYADYIEIVIIEEFPESQKYYKQPWGWYSDGLIGQV
jgi:hypothetical protein